MLFDFVKRLHAERINREQEEADRERVVRAITYKRFLTEDILRLKFCLLGSYSTDPDRIHLTPERFKEFSEIRSRLHGDMKELENLDIFIPSDVRALIDSASLYDFNNHDDCKKYFEKLDLAFETLVHEF